MIKEVKLKKTKKLKRNYKRKNNKKNSIYSKKLTKISTHQVSKKDDQKNNETKKSLQEGGSNNSKENFEVKRLTDIDYSQFSLTKYLNSNVDWGLCPGPPPMDCCIM